MDEEIEDLKENKDIIVAISCTGDAHEMEN